MSRVIFVASGKGGVGKSVFSANLGATFADKGLSVALVDMNIGLRNLDLYLGLESKVVFDSADVISGVVPLKRALVRDKRLQALYFLSTTQRKEKFAATEEQVARLYAQLAGMHDIVIIDGPAGVTQELRLASSGVSKAVIVTTPEHVSLRDADMMDQTLRSRGVMKRAYVVNKANKAFMGDGILPSFETITTLMKLPLIGVIQQDDAIHLSANKGYPIVLQRGNYIERNFSKISDRILSL
ncbi:MAG: septum site-determining protein MinD [Clostridiales Family XIII bacterium]|jgi:septum site-determining protein MinD|nr:septum site-determining protein MinD [Clostridiales Family XIII bacterium]